MIILISLALFQSAANESGEAPKPSETKKETKDKSTEKSLSQTEQKDQAGAYKKHGDDQKPPPKPVSQKTPEPKKQPETQEPQEHWYDFLLRSNMPNWVVIVGWVLAFTVAWWTLGTMNKQTEATRAAASVAELALKIDRPYLLIERVGISGIHRQDNTGAPTHEIAEYKSFSPHAEFTFRNYGKGPALLDESVMRLFPITKLPAAGDFTDCKSTESARNDTGHDAIGAGDRWGISNVSHDRLISPEDYKEILDGTKKIAVWGRVRYKDVFKDSDPYETIFCYELGTFDLFIAKDNPPIRAVGRLMRGPKTHNYHT